MIVQELSDEVLVYDLSTDKAYNLNETSSFVWQNCDGGRDVDELAQAMTKKFNRPVSEEMVWLALEGLKKEGLVEHECAPPESVAGLSRRQMIRRVGLGSMVALPMISALVAPTAAHAQSGGSGGGVPPECVDPGTGRDINKTPNGQACKGNGNCCSNVCCATAGGDTGICNPVGTNCQQRP